LNVFAERNFELSIAAVQAAVYQICLGSNNSEYARHGKIVTYKGETIDTQAIMHDFCRSQDKISLDKLLAFEEDLTGEIHRWIPIQAGYGAMVRTNERTFIADKYLDFDTNVIDNAIEHFMGGGEYVPIQAVTTFAMFPHCGQDWNFFLLESYCWRFSPNFRIDTRSVNSKNVGAIVRKNSRLTYDDIMADCIAHSNVPLMPQAVLNYLRENGLISARKHKNIGDLIKKARMIRERRS